MTLLRKAQGAFDKGFAPRLLILHGVVSRWRAMDLRPWPTFRKLTDQVCGTNMSTLKRERVRAHQPSALLCPEVAPRFQAEREGLKRFYLIANANIWP